MDDQEADPPNGYDDEQLARIGVDTNIVTIKEPWNTGGRFDDWSAKMCEEWGVHHNNAVFKQQYMGRFEPYEQERDIGALREERHRHCHRHRQREVELEYLREAMKFELKEDLLKMYDITIDVEKYRELTDEFLRDLDD